MPKEECGPAACAVAARPLPAYLLAMTAAQNDRSASTPSVASAHDKILIVDFGSQVTQLIARRVREDGVYCEIVPFNKAESAFNEMKPKAVILSGGPESVHEAGSPRAPPRPAPIIIIIAFPPRSSSTSCSRRSAHTSTSWSSSEPPS